MSVSIMVNFIENFDAINTMINERMIAALFMFAVPAFFCIRLYLITIFSIKKSDKAIKIISKQYNFIQRLFCVHYNENVYKKVDRLYFDIIYKFHYFYLGLFTLVLLSLWISKYVSIFNEITCILLIIYAISTMLILLCFFIFTKCSPMGGVEFRGEKKYRGKKNW